ncbi:hypothetical protein HID58_091522 [Brassica napus]|uniref:Methyltransferase type 11 domain-containing protein n=1 Tax=Brassica napus TaxID=3708 RepID=A0ABQ7WZN6_BRANA|nr:hypothetical protein HID58_091522 [Brassica napus]
MPMTVVPGRFTPAILSIGSRLPSFKYTARRVAVFVPRSAASISVETNSSVDSVVEKEKDILACPICYNSLALISKPNGLVKVVLVRADIARLPFLSGSVDAVHAGAALHCWPSPSSAVAEISRVLRPGGVFVATTFIYDGPFSFIPFLKNLRQLQCNTCKKSYSGNDTHLDLAVASGSNQYTEPMPLSTELFRTPLVSFLYERGWRQNFIWGGFPGPEKEFEMAKDYLKPVFGGNIIDASCGSGMFSRLFARSELFSRVVALDYSENMLKQCYDFLNQEENLTNKDCSGRRADIARLLFFRVQSTQSMLVAEISRVLRLVEYLLPPPSSMMALSELMRYSGSHIFLSERELEDLCKAGGLVGFTRVRNGLFIMLSATKPSR